MSISLRPLCHPPCDHCVTYLLLYVFHCAKIDSVQTHQWTQGQKRLVGARYSRNEVELRLAPIRRFLIALGLCLAFSKISCVDLRQDQQRNEPSHLQGKKRIVGARHGATYLPILQRTECNIFIKKQPKSTWKKQNQHGATTTSKEPRQPLGYR